MNNKQNNETMITKDEIFEGAVFTDKDGDDIKIEKVSTNRIYAVAENYDLEFNSIMHTVQKLNEQGFRYVGVDI